MNLTTRLFLAFLLSCMAIAALMTGIIHYYATSNFSAYIRDVEIKQLGDITVKLEDEYQRYGNWNHIRSTPAAFGEILRSVMHSTKTTMPPPPSRGRESFRGSPSGQWPPPPTPPDMPQRLMLFDGDKRPIFGKADPMGDYVLKTITSGGKIVGWLGLHRPERISDPLQLKFLYRQSRALIVTGIGIIILSALVSLLLSRQILMPVKRLAQGAHLLASRRFDTRIDTHSSDELGRLSLDFNSMADTLERYEFSRKQWITDISHELRTPLAVMRAEIEAIQDGIREVNPGTFQSLHSEVMLLSRIVDDLRSLSAIDSDMLYIKMESFDPVRVAQKVIAAFESRFEKAGVKILVSYEKSRKILITGDPERLAQVFSNILENTLKYTDPPGTLRVNMAAGEDSIHMAFEDSPPGVPEESMQYLFERLYKTDASRTRQKGGSGLGLSICRGIVAAMNGTIKAGTSGLGGLRIDIVLPLSEQS
jgi:two-component system, OmpR family, sensor histidine kinase BaeS